MKQLLPVLAVLFLSSSLAPYLSAQDWPQWRGPTRDGMVPTADWPKKLSKDTLKLKWRTTLDKSYSSPIIGPKRVYTVETLDKKKEVVRALDRETGEEIWSLDWEGSMKVPFFAARNGSWVRSTPAFDGERLYVGGIRDVMVAIDAATGKEVWRVDFKERYKTPVPSFGFVCSPLIAGDALYIQAGGRLCKLNSRTGETIWEAMEDGGGMYGSAFSSPTLASIHGKDQLVMLSRTHLAGVDPEDGSELWKEKIEAFRGMNILTPTVKDNAVFTAAYGGTSMRFDLDTENKLTKAWDKPLQGYMSSPLLIDDHIYLHMRNERMVCINYKTGEKTWTSPKGMGKYLSMISQGDRILALNHEGVLYHMKANPEKQEILSAVDVSKQETWAHIAMVDNRLYIRELESMAVYEWTEEASDSENSDSEKASDEKPAGGKDRGPMPELPKP